MDYGCGRNFFILFLKPPVRLFGACYPISLHTPNGTDFIRDDVRLGGAVADTGAHAGQRAAHIHDLVEENRENVKKLAGNDTSANDARER